MTKNSNNGTSERQPLLDPSSPSLTYFSAAPGGILENNISVSPHCPGIQSTENGQATKRRLIIATTLCLLFFAAELAGGFIANSLALMSDAFHLLSDIASFAVALAAILLAEMPATKRHSFGFHRAEVIAALVSVFTIWILTAYLVSEAIERIRNPQPIDGKTMLIVSSLGVVVNLILMFSLGHGHSHGHSHDHDHDHDPIADSNNHQVENDGQQQCVSEAERGRLASQKPKVEANINVKAAALHVIGDLISSIGVLISSIIIMIDPTKTIVDPICTFIFSILVLFTTYRLVVDSVSILMEGTPSHINPQEVKEALEKIQGVRVVHDLHIWTLTAGKTSLAVHLQVEPATAPSDSRPDFSRILTEAQHLLCDDFGIHHSTVQIEEYFTQHCAPVLCASK
ncbi:uncharacterized protein VTP21DRAFT_4227 [Calcarisporiella thermophila]|uniref:uncharacterized protein n=1 Tax=Calcarisporiella thermophila TaxID=911321 RepID=UPI003742A1C2